MKLSWIPEHPYPGRLALSVAPGSHRLTPLTADLQVLTTHHIKRVICLLEDEEFEHLPGDETASSCASAMAAANLEYHRFPFEDYTAPSNALMDAILVVLQVALARGEGVLVHCMAGRGRAGTVAACLLVACGLKPDEAILLVRWFREGAIQSADQEDFIKARA